MKEQETEPIKTKDPIGEVETSAVADKKKEPVAVRAAAPTKKEALSKDEKAPPASV